MPAWPEWALPRAALGAREAWASLPAFRTWRGVRGSGWGGDWRKGDPCAGQPVPGWLGGVNTWGCKGLGWGGKREAA